MLHIRQKFSAVAERLTDAWNDSLSRRNRFIADALAKVTCRALIVLWGLGAIETAQQFINQPDHIAASPVTIIITTPMGVVGGINSRAVRSGGALAIDELYDALRQTFSTRLSVDAVQIIPTKHHHNGLPSGTRPTFSRTTMPLNDGYPEAR